MICIVETWLSSEILDNPIFCRDRDCHDGVMIYAHSCLAVDLHVCSELWEDDFSSMLDLVEDYIVDVWELRNNHEG